MTAAHNKSLGCWQVLSLGSGGGWDAFDATSVYNPRGDSGGAFGSGHWYYAPHEDIDARCLVPPPRHGGGVASSSSSSSAAARPGPATCTGCWQKAITKPPFAAPLWPKPTLPIHISTVTPQSVLPGAGAGSFRVLLEARVRLAK